MNTIKYVSNVEIRSTGLHNVLFNTENTWEEENQKISAFLENQVPICDFSFYLWQPEYQILI